jgi:hypothetical protein
MSSSSLSDDRYYRVATYTRKLTGSYPVYRLFLRLYPRTYRQEYGDQMVQTLQDMLDNCETPQSRALVWLRVSLEMPLSALQENISNGGEKGMKKLAFTSDKRLRRDIGFIIAAILIVVIGLGHDRILAGTDNILYGRSIHATTASENVRIGDPFQLLTGTSPKFISGCMTQSMYASKPEVNCTSTAQAYTKLGQTAADKAKVLNEVATITSALKAQGYTAGSNNVTLMSLVAGTYKGIDWSPDAAYMRNIGKDSCLFDTTIAYSNTAHQQPAIHMSLFCDRILAPFGEPTSPQAIYQQ